MLLWFEVDGDTPLGEIDYGNVGPGQSYSALHSGPKHLKLRNTGLTPITGVQIAIEQVANFPAYQWVKVAVGSIPSEPEGWGNHEAPVDVGTIEGEAEVDIYLDFQVPVFATRLTNQLAMHHAYGD